MAQILMNKINKLLNVCDDMMLMPCCGDAIRLTNALLIY